MKRMPAKLSVLLVAAMAAGSLSACGGPSGDTIATYGSEKISKAEAEFWLRYEQWQYESYYWDIYTQIGYDNMWEAAGSDDGTSMADSVHTSVMAQILQTEVVLDHAADYGIDGLTDAQKEQVKSSVEEFLEANPLFLETVGVTEDDMITYLEKNAEASLVIQAVKDAANVEITDDQCKKYAVDYILVSEPSEDDETEASEEETEAADTETEEEDTLEGLELANEVLKQAEAGDDFSDIASQYDDASSSSTTYLVNDETSTDTPYTASQDMEVGEVKLVEVSGTGWYIVKKVNDYDEDASESERSTMQTEAEDEAFDTTYAEWSENASKFKVNEKTWNSITIEDKIYETEASTEDATEEDTAEVTEETEAAETDASESAEAETETEAAN